MTELDPVGAARDDGQRILIAEVLGAAVTAGVLPAEATDEQVDAVLGVMRSARAAARAR